MEEKKEIIDSKKLAIIVLVIAFLFKIWLIVWQFTDQKYLIAPGGDPVQHLGIVQQILAGKLVSFAYPPLYHFIVAGIVKLTGLDILLVMKYLAIALLFLPVPFFWYLVRQFFGFWSAFWATILYLLVSSNPLLGFVDGNYPDLLSYGVFVPLTLLFLVKALQKRPLKYALLSLLFAALMILTHHLTAIFTLLVVIVYLIAAGVYFYFGGQRWRLRNLKIVLLCWGIFGIVLILLVKFTFGAALIGWLKLAFAGTRPINSITHSSPADLAELSALLAPMIEFLGAAGLIYAFVTIKEKSAAKIMLIVWVLVLWILSRTVISGLAPRYLRELSVPLCMLSGILIVYFVDWGQTRMQKIIISGILGYLVFINIVQLTAHPFLLPRGFQNMVWYRQVDQKKAEYLSEYLFDNAVILANPSNPYLPYFLEKKNSKIHLKVINDITKIAVNADDQTKQEAIRKFLIKNKADFLFIGAAPMSPPIDEDTFSEFKGFQKTTDFFALYEYPEENLAKEFSDGSKLIWIEK